MGTLEWELLRDGGWLAGAIANRLTPVPLLDSALAQPFFVDRPKTNPTTHSRLVGTAVRSAALLGVLTRRPEVTLVGAICLFGLGIWQAVLGIVMLPVVALLLLAAGLEDRNSGGVPSVTQALK